MNPRDSDRYFQALLENAADAITVVNADNTIRYTSPAVERILGYTPEERREQSMFELVHSDDLAALREGMQRMRSHPADTVNLQIRAKHRDGDWRYLEVRARNLLEDPDVAGIVINWHDITDRITAEGRLKAREDFFRQMVELSGQGISVRDANGTLTFLNERLAEMLGYTVDELLGKSVFDVVAPEHRQMLKDTSERRRDSGKAETIDLELVRKDGSSLPVLLSASPLYDDAGQYSGALGMVTDMTDRKTLEHQLRQSQKIEAVGRLAGGVAHDFNNLLTSIRGHVELLLSEVPRDSHLFNDIEEIRKAGDRAAALTQQLLAFSRRQMLQPRVIEVDKIVRNLEPVLQQLMGEKVTVVTKLSAGSVHVHADPSQIEQVILNLAANSRDAMTRGGTLTLETNVTDVDADFVLVNAGSHPGPHLQLLLADTGKGMDADALSHVFEPFYTTKGVGQGTGLGLATVYGIVKQSGGYIMVQSERGLGTRFEILLPLVHETPREQFTLSRGSSVHARGETVLVAEDEDAVRALTTRILRKRGYAVLEARHGGEALEIAQKHTGHIDLLLTDVIMPVLGGRELAERLVRVRPAVKVLFMSGYANDALLQHGVSQGSRTFLEKPFTPDALATKVREVLEDNGAQ